MVGEKARDVPFRRDRLVTVGLPAALAEGVEEMRDCILTYVSANLHPGVSLEDFKIRLGNRLLAIGGRADTSVAIMNAVRDLVHDQNRTVERQEYRFRSRSQSSVDEVTDSSLNVEHRLISQSEALAILSRISDVDRKLVKELYGIGVKEIPRDEIAKELGLSRNTLDQRLRRLLRAIRLI